jgi:type VI secretion system secreted protein VgrG
MGKYTQANHPMTVQTPLGPDALFIAGFHGEEAVSVPFHYQLELFAPSGREVPFDKLLGQPVTVRVQLPQGQRRFFNGVCSAVSQGFAGQELTGYHATVVPRLWLLSRRTQSRIFQDLPVPDILREVFDGLDVSFRLRVNYEPREYCVQYRESDLAFASRLMEDEGIFYFFEHEDDKHTLVVGDNPGAHPDLPGTSVLPLLSEPAGPTSFGRITSWVKRQDLRSGKFMLWDHTFELPHKHLEAVRPLTDSVQVGQVVHRLRVPGNEQLEAYDWPGDYALRFDGVNRGGGDQSAKLSKVYADGPRTAALRAEQEACAGLAVEGAATCPNLTAGHAFAVQSPALNGVARWYKADGPYVFTRVAHAFTNADFRSGGTGGLSHSATFTAIPRALPFRPPRTTPRPFIPGPQTAVVAGSPGEEICVDKYGRVKVQFHWDREGDSDLDSSCWVRVAQFWAGKRWGAHFWPRVGQEVVVTFLEGDPDRPLITGSVYNAENMPPYELPKYKTKSGVKTRGTPQATPEGFNELRFEDKKGKEQVFLHSQNRMDVRVRGSLFETCGGSRNEVIGARTDGKPGGDHTVTVGGDHDLHIQQGLFAAVEKKLSLVVVQDAVQEYQANRATKVRAKDEVNAREITLEALTKITLKVGSSFVVVDLTGVTIQGPIVKINSGGAAVGTSPMAVEEPLDAEGADTGEPGFLDRPHGGGGRRGRVRRPLLGYHAPAVTRNPDGTMQFGKGIRVAGDQNYQQGVLSDLAVINTTPSGQKLLRELDESKKTTTIQPDPKSSPGRPHSDEWPGDPENHNFVDATREGKPVFDGKGRPYVNENGKYITGSGRGSDTTVQYDPSHWPDPTSRTKAPSDVILFHELQHANNDQHGHYDGQPRKDRFVSNEEFNAIQAENEYRDERDVRRRFDHEDR